MKSIALLSLSCLIYSSACSIPRHTVRQVEEPQQIFHGSYDEVWAAALKVLDSFQYKYPTANKDSGFIETDVTTGYSKREYIFSGGEKFPKESKWKLTLRFLVMKSHPSSPKVRLRIKKEEEVNQGFLEGWKKIESDLLTEKVILYRIGRVLYLNKKIELLSTPQE